MHAQALTVGMVWIWMGPCRVWIRCWIIDISKQSVIGHSRWRGLAYTDIYIADCSITEKCINCWVFWFLPFWLTEKEHKQNPMNLATKGSSPPVLLYWMLLLSLCLLFPNSHKAKLKVLILTSYVITLRCSLIIEPCAAV